MFSESSFVSKNVLYTNFVYKEGTVPSLDERLPGMHTQHSAIFRARTRSVPTPVRRVVIVATYSCSTSMSLDLPEGRIWDEVDCCKVQWDEVHLRFKDGTRVIMPFTADITTDSVDYQLPNIEVYSANDPEHPGDSAVPVIGDARLSSAAGSQRCLCKFQDD
jgi:hypothetical protein